jgi:YHS domain-containing protein
VIRFLLLSILILLIARVFWRVMDSVIQAASGQPPRQGRSAVSAIKLARDPVCGTFVTPGRAISTGGAGGHPLEYFCSERCRDEFVAKGGARPRSHAS